MEIEKIEVSLTVCEMRLLHTALKRWVEDVEAALIYGDDDFGSLSSSVYMAKELLIKIRLPPQECIPLIKMKNEKKSNDRNTGNG